jgi:hypothetical protein
MASSIDKLDAIKKEKFVDAYKKTIGNITDSASIAGIARATYYNWLAKDKDFAIKILDSEANLNDEVRQVLIQKAYDGDMAAVIFYLKKRHPDFKDGPNIVVQQNFRGVLEDERKEFEL